MIEKRGDDKTRYAHDSCACQVTRVSSGWSQFFFAGHFPLTVHTTDIFSAGVGSLSLMLEVDGFGFT